MTRLSVCAAALFAAGSMLNAAAIEPGQAKHGAPAPTSTVTVDESNYCFSYFRGYGQTPATVVPRPPAEPEDTYHNPGNRPLILPSITTGRHIYHCPGNMKLLKSPASFNIFEPSIKEMKHLPAT